MAIIGMDIIQNPTIFQLITKYNQNITLITDGQLHESLYPDDIVSITKSNFEIGLIDFKDSDYFQTLRTKMGWGTRGNGGS